MRISKGSSKQVVNAACYSSSIDVASMADADKMLHIARLLVLEKCWRDGK